MAYAAKRAVKIAKNKNSPEAKEMAAKRRAYMQAKKAGR